MQIKTRSILVLLLGLSFSLTACDDGDDGDEAADETGDGDPIDILGSYVDDFGYSHTINETHWLSEGSTFTILEYDNAEMAIIAQNDPTNAAFPDLFSRFDWAWDGEDLYFCQSVFDGATIDDARNGGADPDDLAAGCGGFPWSMLTPA